ncbi:protein tipE-like [Macrobrachium rosenbergii]|uniref:protein tipE-like n=1 Tax=Macrobrachium rosenbergii TaxID=79674 RepID=UPI0034D6511A
MVPAADEGSGGSTAVRPVTNAYGGQGTSPKQHRSLDEDSQKSRKKKQKPHKNSKEKAKKHAPSADPSQLDAGKQALKELLKERRKTKKNKTSCTSLLKLYTTILAGLMIIGGLFTLLFLVPMTIDPALATLTYEFHPKPVLCMTTFADWVSGQTSINWCSCTMGCTSDIFNCSQVVVVYRNCKMTNSSSSPTSPSHTRGNRGSCTVSSSSSSIVNTTYIDPDHWDVLNASLYINVKGCGYPPAVNCTTFFDHYGVPGRRFWCYYSKMDPYLVMPEYDREAAEMELVNSLGWTVGAQVVGILIIVLLHCPFIAFFKNLLRRRAILQPKNLGGVVNHGATNSMTSLVSAWKEKDKPRQPVFQRDWYEVHT